MELSVKTTVRFITFPLTMPPPDFIPPIVRAFEHHEPLISTIALEKGLESDPVLQILAPDLARLGFSVESSKGHSGKIPRPVFFGEGGQPSLLYAIDAYHQGWRCGLEVEAGRAILGNAVFRDLFQAMVMTDVDHLCLAVPNTYKYKVKDKALLSKYYDKTVADCGSLVWPLTGQDAVPIDRDWLLKGASPDF